MSNGPLFRRDFIVGSLASVAAASCSQNCSAPAALTSDKARPTVPCGVQTGDPTPEGVVLWSKTDRPARMLVEWGTDETLGNTTRLESGVATAETDYTAKLVLSGLPKGRRIHYRVTFEADDSGRAKSEPVSGSFRAPPGPGEDTKIVWSGDTVGQGWGIDLARGGMKTYASIARLEPDIFIHSGDRIYADDPLVETRDCPDGSIWKNLLTPAKSKVAEALEEFRGCFAYNFLDEHVRSLSARTPTIVQWDDHEVRNNWFPAQILTDKRYRERRVSVLAERARRAMMEYAPMRPGPIHRVIPYGPRVAVFVLDARSFRNPNGPNREAEGDCPVFGKEQVDWLLAELAKSPATWKIVACDQPLGLVIPDEALGQEGFSNADDGPPLGREREVASILAALKNQKVKNVLWVTADVHYAAAHQYDPSRAKFTNFDPFWELVAGPLHAGNFGPNALDATFGPEVLYRNMEFGTKVNQPPWSGTQSFGMLAVDGKKGSLRATLHDGEGRELWGKDFEAET